MRSTETEMWHVGGGDGRRIEDLACKIKGKRKEKDKMKRREERG